ncbi:MAG TPA: ABC transporter permease [Verrucomicrobiae bacterium]|nr:ABC transporter permease [Verrucomicrobiae bacterium]
MSRLPFELFLALRYLRPKRTFVSVITLISVIGVMLGVAVLIVVISVMTGFDRQLRDKILGFNSHLRVYKYDDAMGDYREWMQRVAAHPAVKAVAPTIIGQVLMETQPSVGKPQVAAPFLRGIDPAYETNVSTLATSLVAGELTLDGDNVVVGSELARSLRLSVGDHIAIYSPRQLQEMRDKKGKADEVAIPPDDFTVRGIFDVGYFEYNANVILTSLRTAQSLYELRGKVHGLQVMLHDPNQAPAVRAELRQLLGPEFGVGVWTEENPAILTAIAVEKNVMFYLLSVIVVVAAFGIMNSQITFVVQKTREIGMLKALGATRRQLMALFLGQSLVVGSIGIVAGLGLGLLFVEIRNPFMHFINWLFSVEVFPASIYNFSELPAVKNGWDIARICGAAFVLCVLAGLAPAWNAGRLRPVEALRHE